MQKGFAKNWPHEWKVNMSDTKENLMDAFAGESQANRKYLAFAKKADSEGFVKIAMLFRAAAEAETVHAHAHLKACNGVGATVNNLKAAITGETYEFENMYPKMIETAIADEDKVAERSFRFANEVEKIHAELYQKALDNIDRSRDVDCYYVCSVCGNTVENEAPESCPICNAKSRAFTKVE